MVRTPSLGVRRTRAPLQLCHLLLCDLGSIKLPLCASVLSHVNKNIKGSLEGLYEC